MIADKSGSLSSIKRHDYLPFGEELFAGTGGRTTTQGYVNDSVRQKFTGKERDNETGLDYFGARYYANAQGRFTSPDPLLSSGDVANPQSWNRYAYTYNNPVNLIDVLGLYTWGDGVTDDFKKQFKGWLKDIEKARDGFKSGSKEYNRLNDVLKAYGEEGKGGPSIRLSETLTDGKTPTDGAKAEAEFKNGKLVSTSVTFNPKALDAVNGFTVAHEGTHLVDYNAVGASFPAKGGLPTFNPTVYDLESKAYETEQIMARGLNVNHDTLLFDSAGIASTFYLYKQSWRELDEKTLQNNMKGARDQIVKQDYNVTEKDPGPRMFVPKRK